MHAACNYGHVEAATYLASIHTNLDLQDVVSYTLIRLRTFVNSFYVCIIIRFVQCVVHQGCYLGAFLEIPAPFTLFSKAIEKAYHYNLSTLM